MIVAGGGQAGCATVVVEASEDAKVLLLEKTGILGVAAIAGLVDTWEPFADRVNVLYNLNSDMWDMVAKMRLRWCSQRRMMMLIS